MGILFGHPTGNPNSHQAALAHFETDRLAAFCVPWMPRPFEMGLLRAVPGLRNQVSRLERRAFSDLYPAPRIEGRWGEWMRMAKRLLPDGKLSGDRLSYEANDWLMRTMKRNCQQQKVTAVHSYEDCSLWQFEEARKSGKVCIYDMPIGYYPAWEDTQKSLINQFEDWLPEGGLPTSKHVRPDQKIREMELADLVLVPSTFVKRSITQFIDKKVALAPYRVDSELWKPSPPRKEDGRLRFLYVGQISLRKGIPLLIQAWKKAQLKDARLELVGIWQLAMRKQKELPEGVTYSGPCSRSRLREFYQNSDVFVFPSYFEGYGLVITEALACGVPVLASNATAAPDVLDESCGCVFESGNLDQLVDLLRHYSSVRDRVSLMREPARKKAEGITWENYRRSVSDAVVSYD